jgi:hypothetical protein
VDSLRIYATDGAPRYRRRGEPASRWRRRARAVIVGVLEANPTADAATLIALVDAAYPFGPREHHPYKAWLAERRLLIVDLEDVPRSAEESNAIEVANDMMEEAGRNVDGSLSLPPDRAVEIAAWLDEHAPHRHARPCPTCGRDKGKPCREPNILTAPLTLGLGFTSFERKPEFVDRLIPHAARVQR